MTKQLLLEATPTMLSLVEGKGAQAGKKIARGEFGRVDEATANGRSYPKTIIEREIKRLGEDLEHRRVLGELDHPQDGKTSLKRVSHLLTRLWIDDQGRIMGEAEVLPTPEGKTLQALIEANVQIGVSSRGFGSTRPVERGGKTIEEVGEDYVLKTFDFVCEPAMRTAYPAIYTEDVDAEQPDPSALFVEAFPDVVRKLQEDAVKAAPQGDIESRLRAELSERFERTVAESMISLREDVAAQLRAEYEADPHIAAAKVTLTQIAEMLADYHVGPDERATRDAIKAKDLEIADRDAKLAEALETAQRATFLLHVERKITGHHMAESIRELFKGVPIASIEDADTRLGTILGQLPPPPQPVAEDSEALSALREENARLSTRAANLEERMADLNDRLKEAKQIGEKLDARRQIAEERVQTLEGQLTEATATAEEATALAEEVQGKAALDLYKHEKVAGLSNSRELLALMEGIADRAKVDELVARRGTTMVSDAELEQARKAVGRGHVGARSELNEEEARRPGIRGDADPVFDRIGTSLEEASRLAGG